MYALETDVIQNVRAKIVTYEYIRGVLVCKILHLKCFSASKGMCIGCIQCKL